MANEPSSRSSDTTAMREADSYIGSFISLTSKSEIRYEGFIYYLNTEDCTLGLKDVRSFGTEGRKRNGQQIPPSDKVYECILFRGSDIKDLLVKAAQPVQVEDPIYNDPAIIQPNCCMGPSSSSKSVSVTGGSSTEFNLHGGSFALNAGSYPSMLPSQHSGTQLTWGLSLSMHTAASYHGMPTVPEQWLGYNGAPERITGVQQQSSPSTTASYPMQYPASTTIAAANLRPSPPFHHSTSIKSDRLIMPLSLTYQTTRSLEDQVDEAVPDPVSLLPVESSLYSTPSVSDPISGPSVRQQQALLTSNVLEPKPSELSPSKRLYPGQKDLGGMGPRYLNFSSSASTPAVQLNLLPLPPTSQELRYNPEFTAEFDFQAMNEKFKKDEVWEYLRKTNQREKVEGIHESGTSIQVSGGDNSDLGSNGEPQLAYNKDDFFDTISGNSIGCGARNGRHQLSERRKLDSETFGNSHWRTPSGYGRHRAGHGEHRGRCSRGRGYNYRNRGRGGYKQR